MILPQPRKIKGELGIRKYAIVCADTTINPIQISKFLAKALFSINFVLAKETIKRPIIQTQRPKKR